MKNKSFVGEAFYPKWIRPGEPAMGGVKINQQLPQEKQDLLMRLRETFSHGDIGVSTGKGGTAVIFLGPASDPKTVRKWTESLARSVSEITGVTQVVIRQLDDYKAVSNRLAV